MALPPAAARLLPAAAPTSLLYRHRPTLYQTLSRLPHDGVGAKVVQSRWAAKGIEGSYWEVTKVKLKREGQHGKAWGRLIWRGKIVSPREELIRGGLKYMWKTVPSQETQSPPSA